VKSSAIVIPARIDSTRLPGKMLLPLNGVPLIKYVYNKCQGAGFDTFVLTDSRRVAHLFPYSNVVYTGDADNGTDRCCQALEDKKLDKYNRIINVQGDMPDITPEIIRRVEWQLNYHQLSTAYTTMTEEQRADPNSVKVIHNREHVHWFGRGITGYGDHHLGVYGYRRDVLEMYKHLPACPEENIEKLEQLRWLQHGYRIAVTPVEFTGLEINTQNDLDRWHDMH
jgi:3-deoxy-manno-octulosonate cytidylyltransferase (CMP-KDO synthetase)